jgi:hypothetical protein
MATYYTSGTVPKYKPHRFKAKEGLEEMAVTITYLLLNRE